MLSETVKIAIGRIVSGGFPRIWMERELRLRPNHFEREFFLVPIFCNREKIAIDIGANEGKYSYYMKKFSRKVIAFEPNTDLWKKLRRLIGGNYQLESAALSGKSSKATLRVDRSNTGISTIEEKNDLSCAANIGAIVYREVETRTLDSYNIADVAMIKIDVEGHEEAVVDGAFETIRRNRPVLLIESEDRHNFGAPRRLAESFARLDYMVFYVKDRKLLEFGTLRPDDTDPENLSRRGSTYVNNFVYIPAEQDALIARAQAFLTSL
jgi:FkbM family methyltransferase